MANEEHLNQLKQGVEVWNQWREENSEIVPDLSNVYLNEAYLNEANLSGADLRGALLNGASLYAVDLRNVKFSGADLSGVKLRGANLRGVDLSGIKMAKADLSGADLNGASLSHANLRGAKLRGTKLCEATLYRVNLSKAKLRGADFSEADLSGADLSYAKLRGAQFVRTQLCGANVSELDLREVDLQEVDLREANLSQVNLSGTNLHEVRLCGADLNGADLSGANLYEVNLSNANLSNAKLIQVQALGTNFEKTVLTGACIQDWNINSATVLDGVICEYVYLKFDQQERRPREGIFKHSEFSALFQQAIDTVELIFRDGIDWQAFFQSFQDLRSRYADKDLSIQGIEKKRGGAFVVRLEVAEDADKKAIESSAKELYETKLTLLEQRYRAELQAKDGEIVAYREQSANLMEIVKLQASRPITVEATAVAENSTGKNDLRGAQFGGGFIETNYGTQHGGTINNYGSNAADITRLLTALRDQTQTFPTDQKDEANDVLDDLERDLADEQPDQGRIGRRLKKLVALAAAIGTIASGAAAVTGDLSTFTGNVIELTEQLGIPIEHVQLPPSGTP